MNWMDILKFVFWLGYFKNQHNIISRLEVVPKNNIKFLLKLENGSNSVNHSINFPLVIVVRCWGKLCAYDNSDCKISPCFAVVCPSIQLLCVCEFVSLYAHCTQDLFDIPTNPVLFFFCFSACLYSM